MNTSFNRAGLLVSRNLTRRTLSSITTFRPLSPSRFTLLNGSFMTQHGSISERPLSTQLCITTRPFSSGTAGSLELGSVVEVDEEEAAERILATKGTTLFVDWYADWCRPCHMLSPIITNAVKENAKGVLVKMDVDKVQSVAGKYGISSLPTVICIKDGKIVDSFIGLRNAEQVGDFVAKNTQ